MTCKLRLLLSPSCRKTYKRQQLRPNPQITLQQRQGTPQKKILQQQQQQANPTNRTAAASRNPYTPQCSCSRQNLQSTLHLHHVNPTIRTAAAAGKPYNLHCSSCVQPQTPQQMGISSHGVLTSALGPVRQPRAILQTVLQEFHANTRD
jgi:hypothetical protein